MQSSKFGPKCPLIEEISQDHNFDLRCSKYYSFELIRSEITKKEKNKHEKDYLFLLLMVDRIRGKGVADMQILANITLYV